MINRVAACIILVVTVCYMVIMYQDSLLTLPNPTR